MYPLSVCDTFLRQHLVLSRRTSVTGFSAGLSHFRSATETAGHDRTNRHPMASLKLVPVRDERGECFIIRARVFAFTAKLRTGMVGWVLGDTKPTLPSETAGQPDTGAICLPPRRSIHEECFRPRIFARLHFRWCQGWGVCR